MSLNGKASTLGASGFVQPFNAPSNVTGFISATTGYGLALPGNIAGSATSFGSPANPSISWTPNYGVSQPGGQAPMVDLDDPQCRMLAYPTHCSIAKATTYTPYPNVVPGVSRYPYGSSAGVQLVDGSPASLGNPGFFLPVTDYAEEGARAAGHPSTHAYGNATSYDALMMDYKDGPGAGSTCAPYFYCPEPAMPSFSGYASASMDATVPTCPQSYLKTIQFPAASSRMVVPSSWPSASASASAPAPAYLPIAAAPAPAPVSVANAVAYAYLLNYNVPNTVTFIADGKTYDLGSGQSRTVSVPNGSVIARDNATGRILMLQKLTELLPPRQQADGKDPRLVTNGDLTLMLSKLTDKDNVTLVKYAIRMASPSPTAYAAPSVNPVLKSLAQIQATGPPQAELTNYNVPGDVVFKFQNESSVVVPPNTSRSIPKSNTRGMATGAGVTVEIPQWDGSATSISKGTFTITCGEYPTAAGVPLLRYIAKVSNNSIISNNVSTLAASSKKCQLACYTEAALNAHGLKYVPMDGGNGNVPASTPTPAPGDGSTVVKECQVGSVRLPGCDQCFTITSLIDASVVTQATIDNYLQNKDPTVLPPFPPGAVCSGSTSAPASNSPVPPSNSPAPPKTPKNKSQFYAKWGDTGACSARPDCLSKSKTLTEEQCPCLSGIYTDAAYTVKATCNDYCTQYPDVVGCLDMCECCNASNT